MNWKLKTLLGGIAIAFVGSSVFFCFSWHRIGASKTSEEDILNTELKEIPLSYKVLETKSFNVFRMNSTGEIVKIETTKEEQDALKLKDAPQPYLDNATWLYSTTDEITKYSSETVSLSDYEFMFLVASDTVKIKIPDKEEKLLEAKYIKDKKLAKDGLLKLNEK